MRWRRLNGNARLVLPALAGAYAVAAVAVLPGPGAPVTTYATGTGAAAVFLAAGIALIAAGTAVWWDRPGDPTWPLAVAAGTAWLAPVWVGWIGGPPAVRSLAALMAPFLLPAVAHLLLASSMPPGRRVRAAVVTAGWAATAAVTLGLAAVRNPLHDLRCWSNCSDNNVFLVASDIPAARALGGGWLWFALGAGALLVGWTVWTLATATPARRSIAWPVLVPAGAAAAAESAYAAGLLWYADALRTEPTEPAYPVLMAVFLARGIALTALAAGLAYTVPRQRRRRAAVARLADELGAAPPPGALRAALAASLGDRTLEVGYWLPSTRQWVEATGQPLPPPAPGRLTTAIQRDGQPLAIVRHDPTLAGSPDLAAQIGAAARLAIDNERLRAQTLAHLEQVRASRTRIVASADAARRRLERDLHDGAQQRLLAVSYELRLAQAEGGGQLAAALHGAAVEARAAIAELRELAHGIFPAILDEAGLEPALRTLADTSAVPVTLHGVPPDRLPPDVERAAYLVVVETADKGGEELRVTLSRRLGQLTVEVAGAADDPYLHLADRVGALGGTLVLEAGHLRAEIPCG